MKGQDVDTIAMSFQCREPLSRDAIPQVNSAIDVTTRQQRVIGGDGKRPNFNIRSTPGVDDLGVLDLPTLHGPVKAAAEEDWRPCVHGLISLDRGKSQGADRT